MKKNKLIETRRDLFQFIESIEKKLFYPNTKKMLFPNKHCKKDILYLNHIVKKDVQIHPEVKRKYFGSLRILLPLSITILFTTFFLLKFFAKHAEIHLLGHIKYGYIGKIADYIWIPCLILLFLTPFIIFPSIISMSGVKAKYQSFLSWYKENIKKRPEREVNQLIQKVRVPKYKTIITKMFGIWMVYVRK